MHFELRLEGVYEGGGQVRDHIEREKKVDFAREIAGRDTLKRKILMF